MDQYHFIHVPITSLQIELTVVWPTEDLWLPFPVLDVSFDKDANTRHGVHAAAPSLQSHVGILSNLSLRLSVWRSCKLCNVANRFINTVYQICSQQLQENRRRYTMFDRLTTAVRILTQKTMQLQLQRFDPQTQNSEFLHWGRDKAKQCKLFFHILLNIFYYPAWKMSQMPRGDEVKMLLS